MPLNLQTLKELRDAAVKWPTDPDTGEHYAHTDSRWIEWSKADLAFHEAVHEIAGLAIQSLELLEINERKLKAVLQFGNDVCLGCNREIDTTTCCCGDHIDHGHDSHSAIPMGCDCGRVKSPSLYMKP